jgi:membrane protease YdiL (CAAX protease family)
MASPVRVPAGRLTTLGRDPQLYAVIAASIATGLVLWWWLPAGYARPIAADPWRLAGFLLFYPLLEEWLFRGLLQGELLQHGWGRRRWLGISSANALTTLAFVLLHLVNHPPGWALAVAAPSLALGHLRERHHSLLPALLLHPLFNLTYLVAGLAHG